MHWIFLIGLVTGMRSMTGVAVEAWCTHLGLFGQIDQTWAHWMGNTICIVLFTLAALGEYAADVMPWIPSRTSLGPATFRILMGAFVGAVGFAAQLEPAAGGAILGALGAVVGTWGGAWFRRQLTKRFGSNVKAGLVESACVLVVAIADGYWIHLSAAHEAVYESARLLIR